VIDNHGTLSQTPRITSIDVFRGCAIFFMLLGNKGFGMAQIPALNMLLQQFNHTDWIGIRLIDLVFPSFLFIVGVSMPFSYAKRTASGHSYGSQLLHVITRAVILFLLGSVIMSSEIASPLIFEWSSALQPIAFTTLISFFLLRKSILSRVTVTGIIIILYWVILGLISVSGIPAGTLEKNHNLVFYIDSMLLREAHPDGWGTLLLFMPQIANTLIGTVVGDILRNDTVAVTKMKRMGIISCACLIGGVLMSFRMPVIMKIWTPSYTVFSIGCSSLLMLALYYLIDRRGYVKGSYFFIVFGTNALALYVFHRIFEYKIDSIVTILLGGFSHVFGPAGSSFQIIAVILIEWFILYWMYKRRIFIKL
jgi:predicted acyltransferase